MEKRKRGRPRGSMKADERKVYYYESIYMKQALYLRRNGGIRALLAWVLHPTSPIEYND